MTRRGLAVVPSGVFGGFWCILGVVRAVGWQRAYSHGGFWRVLGTLLHNGVPILPALRISKDSTGNHVLSNAVAEAAENISAGASLGTPLRACGHFPPDVVEMISVGEESNNLEEVLIQIAETTERRTARQLELFVRLLEPILLIVMAAIVLVVIVALLLPIFRQSQLMG